MLKQWKWLAMLAALAIAVAGCGAADEGNSDQQDGGAASEQPAQETPAEQPEAPAGETPTEEPAEEPAKELGVETGETVEIESEIEGTKEMVTVVEYTLTPYNIGYVLRDLLSAPKVENGQVVHTAKMGDYTASVRLEVKEGMSLDQAVEEARKSYADGYEASDPADIGTELNGYVGMVQGYQKDEQFHGFHVFDMDGDAVVIHHTYPYDAGDGMGAIMHDMLKSLKLEK
ncbi:hypothetical protein FE782_18180 [Paenibacillus antri]|uniref:Lipoprotein n=1 Tax=Paenibacillus antri TaxID=2582848 RepID=A0A5R9GE93_9BACL|nr:hypothetical protein [Paenibacillus antri]TLS50973.1 hypothetical protein FE782_18180 [Paenibacillus antri]